MKKALGQTVRDLKREVNKKVLKVPGIEQKTLDATNNESWGPHGSVLAEIAQASRNNQECQIIMSIVWKRINDTGKNWRHVFKALTVLEYLVAHGNERVIDEIREHAYQISTLADFQYIDSSGRDQGINVRKKSQNLVALVNDKERIREIRQKAQANKDKYHSTSSTVGYGDRNDDDRYGSRADQRNGYRDDDRYGRGRDNDERYGRDAYRDGDYGGYRDRANDDYQYSSRSPNRYADRSFDEEGRQLSRGNEHKFGADDATAPPSYEEAVMDPQDNSKKERDGEGASSSTRISSSNQANQATSASKDALQGADIAGADESVPSQDDEFDPRCFVSAPTSPDSDIFGLSTSDSANPSSLVPATSSPSPSKTPTDSVFGTDFFGAPSSASPASNQPNEDPFGDSPFKAVPNENIQAQPHNAPQVSSFQPSGFSAGFETLPTASQNVEAFSNFDFGDAFGSLTYAPNVVNDQTASHFSVEQSSDDILDSILPRTGSASLYLSQEAQSSTPTNTQAAQTNPFQSVGVQGSATNTQSDQVNPFQPSGFLPSVPVQESPSHTQTVEMNSFQSLGLSAEMSAQETLTNADRQTAHMNFPKQSGPAASQGSPSNFQASQVNFFQPSQLSPQAASQGSQNHMQTTHMNFFQPSASTASHGFHPNMQADQLNFLQPSVPAPSQGSQAHKQEAHMNFFASSGMPAPTGSQRSEPNMQPSQSNFIQSSGLPAPGASQAAQNATPANLQAAQTNFPAPSGLPVLVASQGPHTNFHHLSGLSAPVASHAAQNAPAAHMQSTETNFLVQSGLHMPVASQGQQANFFHPSGLSSAPPVAPLATQSGTSTNFQTPQSGSAYMHRAHLNTGSQSMQPDAFTLLATNASVHPTSKSQLSKEKFETKSTVWADTLSRGLVNLDISGPKTNPLSDIGVDFDAINRKDKRLEPKSSAPPVTSTIVMGKAMGSGSGIGRAGSTGFAPPPNSMMGGGMGMGMGMGGGGGMHMGMSQGGGMPMGMGGPAMGMGGYGGNMNQFPMGMNGMGMGMGMGMSGMGMHQGPSPHMRPPPNMMQPQGPGMPGAGYNPMMGMGGYSAQPPYGGGGGYR